MKLLSIDPGLTGSICLYDTDTNEISFCDNERIKIKDKKTISDISNIVNFLKDKTIDKCIIESQHAFPVSGKSACFGLGLSYGIYLGVLHTLNIPYITVSPQKWTKHYNINKYTKEEGYIIATRLKNDLSSELKTPRGRIIDGRSDALLMVLYLKDLINNTK